MRPVVVAAAERRSPSGTKSFAGVSVSARGGAGGVQTITGNESEGPGGGGGGGVVVARGGNITARARRLAKREPATREVCRQRFW